MYPNMWISDGQECQPCDDDPDFFCGNDLTDLTDAKFSIYPKKREQKSTYLYCSNNELLNDPKKVLVSFSVQTFFY